MTSFSDIDISLRVKSSARPSAASAATSSLMSSVSSPVANKVGNTAYTVVGIRSRFARSRIPGPGIHRDPAARPAARSLAGSLASAWLVPLPRRPPPRPPALARVTPRAPAMAAIHAQTTWQRESVADDGSGVPAMAAPDPSDGGTDVVHGLESDGGGFVASFRGCTRRITRMTMLPGCMGIIGG